jgi:hypothetical protein
VNAQIDRLLLLAFAGLGGVALFGVAAGSRAWRSSGR